MNQTAILHSLFGLLLVAGVFTSGLLRIGLFVAAAASFVAGIVVARMDDDGDTTSVGA